MLVELKDCEGLNLFDAIREKAGVGLHSPCGKRGACGGCAVKLLRGRVAEASRVRHPGETVRSCKSIILSGSLAVIVEPRSVEAAASVEKSFEILAPFEALKTRGCSVAVDIGTTTVAASLFSNGDGRVLDSASAVNGQAKFADNLPDRIRLDGKPTNFSMQKEILKTLEELLLPWDGRFSRAVISGNTAMLHFLCGEDASGMGKYPFEPAFLETRDFSSKGLFESLSEFRICTLPSASAFIGADIVAGLMAVGIENAGENCLFVDMGTNGEIVLKKGDSFYSASAAAGPAFEAYGLACGMRASRGAVSSLRIGRGFEVALETIGGAAPAGICGSAYLDFLAEARRGGVLGESGRFAEMCPVKKVDGVRAFFISDELFVSERDIENLLKAKAAVRAAIVTLLKESGTGTDDLDAVFLAGGFGKNINCENACICGLLPRFARAPRYVGNSSLGGAYMCALSPSALAGACGLSRKIKNIDLNLSPFFADTYLDSLFLD